MLDHAEEAIDYLRSHASDADSMYALRGLLMNEHPLDAHRFNDEQVLRAVAAQVSQRHLIVYQKALSAEARNRRTHGDNPSVGFAAGAGAVTPSSLRPRPPAAPLPPSPARPEPTEPDDVDQDAQANTLRLAAVNGVPFCEMCERSKRGESRAAQERQAA